MNNTPETTEPKEKTPVEYVPVDKIPLFHLTEGAHERAYKGRPDKHIPKDAVPYLLFETAFRIPLSEKDAWPEELSEAVGNGAECPYCADTQTIERKHVGVVTGLHITRRVPCKCGMYRSFYKRWNNPAHVAEQYRIFKLDNLERYSGYLKNFNYDVDHPNAPSAFKHLLETVRTHQYNCYLLTGGAGTGKTTLMTAMYRRALQEWAQKSFRETMGVEAVWKIHANALAKQQRDWEMRDNGRDAETGDPTPLPTVTKNKVLEAVRAGFTPCLFIDELDKFKLDSKFQLDEFYTIIDAIQSNNGQVVASTNLTAYALTNALGPQHGPAIVRRLTGPRLNTDKPEDPTDPAMGGFLVDCDMGTIRQDYRVTSAAKNTATSTFKPGVVSATTPVTSATSGRSASRQTRSGSGGGKSNTHVGKQEASTSEPKEETEAKKQTSQPPSKGKGTVGFRGGKPIR
jgi:hypothetical protein